ncbi:hypothetical protein LX64_02580 [Chitinophaga skermanii]|uniref:Uncharacterized protein n=1 Tax=Chitinophaga skermanii TaxID=331697 RepID=A0A327QP45_9BACT|nr:hypothetical protein [Chitinophaga skermanii]RAJ05422.1 hypothetical protein LX64_02580 [Chitinophaga skermanii]
MTKNSEQDIKEFIKDLSFNAMQKSLYFPVDRAFLMPYLSEIMSYDNLDFIRFNLELSVSLYTKKLFLCLPEIWKSISLDDIFNIAEKLVDAESFNLLIMFTYKYLEIDILEELFSLLYKSKPISMVNEVLSYVSHQYHVFVKSEPEIEEYYLDSDWGVDLDKFLYIKQVLLLDKRVKPALLEEMYLASYFNQLLDKVVERGMSK